ncbi:protein of unknown function (plasmid) [Paraburkholderia dioscoreae]|uniref:Uncharacterized protein n=1 Tax=Paraburkholderia dioscoreae TaxID=2604047 RepID=A0A5Q4ZGR8_9BURK|nr:protein of unknown function [Paraburkholderia dioscoreae]
MYCHSLHCPVSGVVSTHVLAVTPQAELFRYWAHVSVTVPVQA